MKRFRFLICFLIVLFISPAAFADQSLRFGFGIGFGVGASGSGLIDDFTGTNGDSLEPPDHAPTISGGPWVSETGTITGAVEDFTLFNETDVPGKVTITRNKITLTAGDRDEDYYVTQDEGASQITDFEHWVDVNVTALTDNASSSMTPWAISNADDDLNDIDIANGDAIFLFAGQATSDTHYNIRIWDLNGGTLVSRDVSSAIAVNAKSFLSISRSSTTLTVEIYSTAALRTAGAGGDVDTITGVVVGTAFRYVYGLGSYNNAVFGRDISGTVSNLRL